MKKMQDQTSRPMDIGNLASRKRTLSLKIMTDLIIVDLKAVAQPKSIKNRLKKADKKENN